MELQQNFRENLGLAMDTVREHKLRSFLAVLVGLMEGFRTTIQEEITSSGVNPAWAWRFNQGPTNGRRPKEERLRKPLSLEDGEAVEDFIPAVKHKTIPTYDCTNPKDL